MLDIKVSAVSQPGAFGDPGTFHQSSYGYFVVTDNSLGFAVDFLNNSQMLFFAAGEEITLGNPGGWQSVAYPTPLPLNQATYLGVRFDPGDGNHYGWIGVEFDGAELEAFAWGYETDPGVPIAAGTPEPGSLALLAFGAGALLRRKRRA